MASIKNRFRMAELKKFTKYTLRIRCSYAIIMRDVSFYKEMLAKCSKIRKLFIASITIAKDNQEGTTVIFKQTLKVRFTAVMVNS